jgi:hypothetical protein
MKQNMFKFFILLKIKHTLSMSTNKKYKKMQTIDIFLSLYLH